MIDSSDLIFCSVIQVKNVGWVIHGIGLRWLWNIFAYFCHSRLWPMVKILESPGTEFMNLMPFVFDVDYVAKIRSWLSITVLEKKLHKIAWTKVTWTKTPKIAPNFKSSFKSGLLFVQAYQMFHTMAVPKSDRSQKNAPQIQKIIRTWEGAINITNIEIRGASIKGSKFE